VRQRDEQQHEDDCERRWHDPLQTILSLMPQRIVKHKYSRYPQSYPTHSVVNR